MKESWREEGERVGLNRNVDLKDAVGRGEEDEREAVESVQVLDTRRRRRGDEAKMKEEDTIFPSTSREAHKRDRPSHSPFVCSSGHTKRLDSR
jgi:hypothetical protein